MNEITTIRLDKWLWQARFFKSRSIAASVIKTSKLLVNDTAVSKPARMVGQGDQIEFTQGRDTKIVRILDCGTRRGPAPEAQLLYHDMSPVQEIRPKNPGSDRKGRPTKRDRRDMMTHLRGDTPYPLE